MRLFLFALILVSAFSCSEKYDVDSYYSASERDSLLTDIITYIYVRPQYATWETRFNPDFRKYYVAQLNKFRFEKYTIAKDGSHYFYLIRPARSPLGTIRGVGGRYKVNKEKKIVSFEEIFNTPVGDLNELRAKGDELFKWMIKNGHVNEYLRNPDFVEWPSDQTYYDTIQHEWLVKPGI